MELNWLVSTYLSMLIISVINNNNNIDKLVTV